MKRKRPATPDEPAATPSPPPLPTSIAELVRRGNLTATAEGLAVELAMRVGELMSANGMSVNDTIATMRRVCRAYGLADAQIDITTFAITASYSPGNGLLPVTAMRTVTPTVPDLTKVHAVNKLVYRIQDGLALDAAVARFEQIVHAREPYPTWLAWIAAGSISATVQLLYSTSPRVLLLALIAGVVLNRLIAGLDRLGVPRFFQQLAGGWFAVALAALISWINRGGTPDFLVGLSPTLAAVGCIFQLVLGMKFVAAMQDAIDGFYVTATARLLQVGLETAGIVIGLFTGLDLANRTGLFVYINPNPFALAAPPIQYAAATASAAVWIAGSFVNWRTLALTVGAALLAWFGYSMALAAGVRMAFACFLGAGVAAFVATLLVRHTNVPGFAVVNASVVALVPGLTLYQGLLAIVGTPTVAADPGRGWGLVGSAAAMALAIAAGASLGTYFGRPIGDRVMPLPLSWYGRLRDRRAS
ncbi:MAG: threonine/serine exporter family protein [Propionibacteriaceae bacterium]|nr:threonine/serine exporter family protein [Propionibacteriaceae bacterium]